MAELAYANSAIRDRTLPPTQSVLTARNLEPTADLTTREVARARIGAVDAIVRVDVHVGTRGPHRGEQLREIMVQERTDHVRRREGAFGKHAVMPPRAERSRQHRRARIAPHHNR